MQILSFKGQLQSRTGQIGQRLQLYINTLNNLFLNLNKTYEGVLKQAQAASHERSYYFNTMEYRNDPEVHQSELTQN